MRHRGAHYRVEGGQGWAGVMHPPPVQQPRIPVWVGGTWPGGRPFRRAARWDGVMPMRADGSWGVTDTRDVVLAMAQHGAFERAAEQQPFAVAVPGETRPHSEEDRDRVQEHAAAGATWWVEAVHPWRYGYLDGAAWPVAQIRDRVGAGPPR